MAVTDLFYINSAGCFVADFPSWLNYLTTGYQGIYGADVYLGADSQDGQWLGVIAQAAFDAAMATQSGYNSFSPATSQGAGLSRVVKINGLTRAAATNSLVTLTVVGIAGTVLTNAIAIDTLSQQWLLPTTTIPLSGTIDVVATAQNAGAVTALANTVNAIFTPTQGWQTVNNSAAATPGNPVITDAELRAEQVQSVALPSLTVFEGTKGAVAQVSGVTAVQGYENDTNSTDGNGLPPHSISIVVVGGSDTDIAAAIQIHKTPGTDTYGTTSVPTVDSRGMPLTINYYIATIATIGVQVTVATLSGWVSSTIGLIQAAMAAAVSTPPIPIGGTVILTQLYAAAYLPGTPQAGTFTVTSIELKKNAGSFGTSNIALAFNEYAFCDPSTDVTVIT